MSQGALAPSLVGEQSTAYHATATVYRSKGHTSPKILHQAGRQGQTCQTGHLLLCDSEAHVQGCVDRDTRFLCLCCGNFTPQVKLSLDG